MYTLLDFFHCALEKNSVHLIVVWSNNVHIWSNYVHIQSVKVHMRNHVHMKYMFVYTVAQCAIMCTRISHN
jgi:hypothetical protein